MKKQKAGILYALAASVFFTTVFPINTVYATEQQETEDIEEETTQETEYPESYFLPIESNAIEGWPAGPQVEGEAAVVMDAETGTFLYSKNMEAKEYPASITKIMTTLVALEHGKLKSKVKFSEWSVNSLETDSSRLWMDVGEWITLEQALYGIILESANDCANAVAEKIGGSEEGFAELMNQKAAELGCVNTHFVNAHGLHNENHYTCARDMALIMRAAMENETYAKIAKTIEYIIPKSKHVREEHVLVNHQKMLFREGFRYKGCLGGKTGFTEAALNTLVTVAQRKGRRLICVIMRTNGPDKICWETKDLLDYGFKKFKREEIPVADGSVTRQDVMGHAIFGKAAVMNAPALSESMLFTAGSAAVSIPKGVDVGAVKQTFRRGNKFSYIFNGWQVGEIPAVFNTVDIMPSFLTLMGLPVPEEVEGKELSECIRGQANTKEGALMMCTGPTAVFGDGNEWRAYRTREFTYAVFKADGMELLFDNQKDPYQMHNLVGDPAYGQVMADLKSRMYAEMERINDHFENNTYYEKNWVENRLIKRTATLKG